MQWPLQGAWQRADSQRLGVLNGTARFGRFLHTWVWTLRQTDHVCAGAHSQERTSMSVARVWVKNQEVVAKNGEISEYRVRMEVTFVLND